MKTLILAIVCFLILSDARYINISPIFQLSFEIQGDVISFSVAVNKTSWVGIGFHAVGSPNSLMDDADIVIARFDGAQPSVDDYYSKGFEQPVTDVSIGGQNNVLAFTASQKGILTEFTFSRKLVTGDSYDSPFSAGPMELIWALGNDNEFKYHGYGQASRGFINVDFFDEDVCGTLQGCQNCVANTSCVFCDTDSLCYDKSNTGSCSSLSTTCQQPTCKYGLPNAWTPQGFCASVWADSLSSPRGMVIGANGDILIVEAGGNRVTALWDSNGDGRSDSSERAVIALASGLNHGIDVYDGYVYASNPTTLFRWRYSGQRTNLGAAQVVVKNIPCCHHTTRTPIFDSDGLLYISVGSGSNVDRDTTHSHINRFNISTIPNGGIDWNSGYVFAYGMRNEVGLAFDNQGRLWGVENGVDNLNRPDLGGDIHTNNPAEEVNLFNHPGGFYGYPYCWSEYNLPAPYGKGKGTQWAQPEFMNDGTHTDQWCQNRANVYPPSYSLAAHQAPLGITFYYGNKFPVQYRGGAFIALHGSWNRSPPQGYKVVYLSFDSNGNPVADTDILKNNGSSQPWPNNVRPVSPIITPCVLGGECLFVTSDASGQIVSVYYTG